MVEEAVARILERVRAPALIVEANRFVELAVVAKKLVVVAEVPVARVKLRLLIVEEAETMIPPLPFGVISDAVEVAHLLLGVLPAPPPSSVSQPNWPLAQVSTLSDSQFVSPAPDKEARFAAAPVIVPPVISGLERSAS